MNTKILTWALIVISVIAITGCNKPLYECIDQRFSDAAEIKCTDDATNMILSAGRKQGWQMKVINPGHIAAIHNYKKKVMKVAIKYNTEVFSITYEDSNNMKYDSSERTIDDYFNEKVSALEAELRMGFGSASTAR